MSNLVGVLLTAIAAFVFFALVLFFLFGINLFVLAAEALLGI